MIEGEKLNSVDKSRVRLEMQQVLVSFIAIGIIIAFVIASFLILIQKSDYLPIRKNTAIFILLLVVFSGFVAFLYNALKDYLKDLKINSKRIYSGQISDKSIVAKWGWHLNPAADSKAQPKAEEYFLVVNNQKIRVEEEEYNKFEIGERVNLYLTAQSNILLGVTKESSSTNKL